jgi:hypothetical protein
MERDAKMYLRHTNNIPHDAIAAEFGVSLATVATGIRRAIQDTFRLSAEEERQVVDDRLLYLERRLRVMASNKHYRVSVSGKVVVDPMTGEPLLDDEPEYRALMAISKIEGQRSKLLGLDMPVRHRVEITDKMDEEIEKLAMELSIHGAGEKVEPELPVGTGVVDGDGSDS